MGLSKSQLFQPVQWWQHPAQTLRSATRCSGTSPTRWTTQSSVTKLNPKARSLTGCGRTELFARRAETSSTTSCQSLAGHSGVTLRPQLADWSAEANSSGVGGCEGVEGRVESVETKRRCK